MGQMPTRLDQRGAMNKKVRKTMSGSAGGFIVLRRPNEAEKAKIMLETNGPLHQGLRIVEAENENSTGKGWYPLYQSAIDRKARP